MKKFISIIISVLMLISCISVSAETTEITNATESILLNYAISSGALFTGTTDSPETQYVFKDFGKIGEYNLCYMAGTLWHEVDYNTVIGKYKISTTREYLVNPLALYLVKGDTVYDFNCDVYDKNIITKEELDLIVSTINTNIIEDAFRGWSISEEVENEDNTILTPEQATALLPQYNNYEFALTDLGRVGDYGLYFDANATIGDPIQPEKAMGNYRFSGADFPASDFSLFIVSHKAIYSLEDAYDNQLLTHSDMDTIYNLIQASKEKYTYKFSVVRIKTPDEIFGEKTGSTTHSLIKLGEMGGYGFYYNNTENVTFLEYDKIIGDYKFNVFSQQTPYDLGLYFLIETHMFNLEEAVANNIVTDMSKVYDMIKSADIKYTFSVEPNKSDEPQKPTVDDKSDNNFKEAKDVKENEVVKNSVSSEDVIDFYKITLTKRQRVTVYTLGTHHERTNASPLAFDIYKEEIDSLFGTEYEKVNKNFCYYYRDFYDPDFDESFEECGYFVDNEKWEQKEDMVLKAGTYYFAFMCRYLGKSRNYKFMYKLSDPVPAFYKKLDYDNEFNKSFKDIASGKYIYLGVADGKVSKWKSQNNKVAKINQKGKITTLTKGSTKIIATLTNGKKLTYYLRVTSDPVLKINGKKTTSVTLKKGDKITVTVKDKATGIKNKYTDTKIAKITGNKTANKFTVKALKKGTTTLRIKVNGVKTLKLKVKVK